MFQNLKLDKRLERRATLVFDRVLRFYQTFNIIAALLGGLALAVMSFDEFRQGQETPLSHASAGLLTSSAVTAVVSITIATMLVFRFEGHRRPTRRDLAVAWTPLILLDLVIVQFLIGLVLWYADKYPLWSAVLVGVETLFLLMGAFVMAGWIWNTMSADGGLGEAEEDPTRSDISITVGRKTRR